jgi:concanavalin A-like lectin/glucanase superfamily protein
MYNFFLLLLFLLSISAYSQNPIAKYEFNGNADDSSGNGLNGTVNATLAPDRTGAPNSCYFFNGISNYIDLLNLKILKPELPVSISFWVNFSSLKPGVLTTDFAQNIHTGVWVALNSEGKIAFSFGDGGSASPASRRTKLGETKLKIDVGYHILGIVRGPSDMNIYINGINDCGTYSGSGSTLAYSSSPGSIGRKDSNPSQPPHYFHGFIDDFIYWDREVDNNEVLQTSLLPTPTNFLSFNVPAQISPALIDTINHTIDITVNCGSSLNLIS